LFPLGKTSNSFRRVAVARRHFGQNRLVASNSPKLSDCFIPFKNSTREAERASSHIDFNEGHRYSDYLPGSDKAAAYGITGVIVGATAAKAGFFQGVDRRDSRLQEGRRRWFYGSSGGN
jgi:Protein of unknown function (DUF2167)